LINPVRIGDAELWLGDCREILPTLGPVDAVVTDPPYHGVKSDAWDNQWETDGDFLRFIGSIADLIVPLLASNGSLYHFASPQMAARIEGELRSRFRILNNIVWNKGESRKGSAGTGIDISALRAFWSASSERIIFAEQYGTDTAAGNASGYFDACQQVKASIIGDYLRSEFRRAGVTNKQVAALFPSKTGGMTGCVSNWLLGHNVPTPEQYVAMREFLNGDGDEFLRREYEDLRREYEDLRREYEDLRREYEDLRRPFYLSPADEWGDVWPFAIERGAEHPTQKPMGLMRHIVKVSTRPDGTVLDPFMGSGTTGVACAKLGRKFIGIEVREDYFDIACRRIEAAYAQPDFLIERPAPPKQEAMPI
jgi:adenine-specific DNA-methyltransferase